MTLGNIIYNTALTSFNLQAQEFSRPYSNSINFTEGLTEIHWKRLHIWSWFIMRKKIQVKESTKGETHRQQSLEKSKSGASIVISPWNHGEH